MVQKQRGGGVAVTAWSAVVRCDPLSSAVTRGAGQIPGKGYIYIGNRDRCKHQTPSESPTGDGEHRGLVLGISPPPPEHRGTIEDDSDDEDDENDEDDDVDDEPPLVDVGKL